MSIPRLRPSPWQLNPQARYFGRVIPTVPPFVAPDSRAGDLIDGIEGLGFTPRTLYIKAETPHYNFLTDRRLNVALGNSNVVPGLVVIEFHGLHRGADYLRRFNVSLGNQIAIPVETFQDVRVRVVDQTGSGFRVVAQATDVEMSVRDAPPVFLSTRDTVALGLFTVPPGAVSMLTRQADPNFSWINLNEPQLETVYPQPLFAGVPLLVAGTAYRITIPLLETLWTVRL